MPTLLLLLLIIPVAAAIAAAALGPRRLDALRWLSLAATLAGLALALVVAVNFAGLPPREGSRTTFQPVFVPGAPTPESSQTTWNVLPLGRAAVQFYVGIDGLNVWLVLLTNLLMVSAVLVSWQSVRERANEYYA